jgi:hypothetical protein
MIIKFRLNAPRPPTKISVLRLYAVNGRKVRQLYPETGTSSPTACRLKQGMYVAILVMFVFVQTVR